MEREEHIVMTPPGRAAALRGLSATAAHGGYSVSREGRLLGPEGSGPAGGWLLLEPGSWAGERRRDGLCRELLTLCAARHFGGVLFTRPTVFLPQLEEALTRHGLRLLVPESCAGLVRRAGVFCSSALSGGCLEDRLRAGLDRFGPERLTLLLERAAEDFFLPAPRGCGSPLTAEALHRLREQVRPCVFFSAPLCARYFTYMSPESGAHFVLFDDRDTMAEKLSRARALGVRSFLHPSPAEAAALPLTAAGSGGKIGPS